MSFAMTLDNRKCKTDYEIRLVGGNDTSEGIVEICHGGVWNSFCSSYHFDNRLAATICYQLGYRKSECTNCILSFYAIPFSIYLQMLALVYSKMGDLGEHSLYSTSRFIVIILISNSKLVLIINIIVVFIVLALIIISV